MGNVAETPLELAKQRRDLIDTRRGLIRTFDTLGRDAIIKRIAADQAEYEAFLTAEGPMEQKRVLARKAALTLEREALLAEHAVKVLKLKIEAIDTEQQDTRTSAADMRAEMQALEGRFEGA